jgi:Mg-chelatase subunit ChlD
MSRKRLIRSRSCRSDWARRAGRQRRRLGRSVGTSEYPVMRVTVLTSEPSSQAPKLRENGLAVRIDRTENLGAEKSVVLAIDRSQSMRGAPLAHAIAAARSFVASKPAEDRVAVASFATKPQLLTDFSTERGDSSGALRSIQVDPVQGTPLYDAVVKSANVLANEPLEARVMIVVTDGNETRSSASLDNAIAAARKAGASIYVVAIESPKFNPAPLHKLAEETGGVYHGTSSSATLSAVRGHRGRAQAHVDARLRDHGPPRGHRVPRGDMEGRDSVPKSITLPASLGPGSADAKPSHLLPAVFYKSVLGTQVMAIISFFIVLIAASLAMTTVKGHA